MNVSEVHFHKRVVEGNNGQVDLCTHVGGVDNKVVELQAPRREFVKSRDTKAELGKVRQTNLLLVYRLAVQRQVQVHSNGLLLISSVEAGSVVEFDDLIASKQTRQTCRDQKQTHRGQEKHEDRRPVSHLLGRNVRTALA